MAKTKKAIILLNKARELHKKGYHTEAYRLEQEANSIWKTL